MANINSDTAPSKDSTLTFRDVNEDNWEEVATLKPRDGQRGNLASNVWSLCAAKFTEDAWLRAIYADEALVGMLLMEIWDPADRYFIWRFMIDGRYQKLGYGKRSIEYAVAHVRQHHPQAKRVTLLSTPGRTTA